MYAWASLFAYLLGLSSQQRVRPHPNPFFINNEFQPFPQEPYAFHTISEAVSNLHALSSCPESNLNSTSLTLTTKPFKLMSAIGFGSGSGPEFLHLRCSLFLSPSIYASLFHSLCSMVSLMPASRLLGQTLNPTLGLTPVPGCRAQP